MRCTGEQAQLLGHAGEPLRRDGQAVEQPGTHPVGAGTLDVGAVRLEHGFAMFEQPVGHSGQGRVHGLVRNGRRGGERRRGLLRRPSTFLDGLRDLVHRSSPYRWHTR